MQGSEDLSAYSVLPVCRIKEKHPDGSLILDEEFIPTCTTLHASVQLKDFMDEVEGTLVERARLLAKRIGSPGQQGIADVAEFMMLQVFNRMQPLFTHLSHQAVLHPQDFYSHLVQTCGELRTFTDESRLAGSFIVYNHDNLTDCFQPLFLAMRQTLSTVLTPRAISVQLHPQPNGIRVGTINDSDLLRSADFVLAVRRRSHRNSCGANSCSKPRSPRWRKSVSWLACNCQVCRWWRSLPHRVNCLTIPAIPTSCWIDKARPGKRSCKATRLPSTFRVTSQNWICSSGRLGAANENACRHG